MRYSGKLGVSEQTEVSPGVWEEVITEHDFLGTVTSRSEAVDQGDTVLPRYQITTTVSGLARGVGLLDNSNLRYLTYAGSRWSIRTDQTKYPKLLLYIGEEYHGPVPTGSP